MIKYAVMYRIFQVILNDCIHKPIYPSLESGELNRNIQNFKKLEEISIFYDGVNVCTHRLLDSQGPTKRKDPVTNKALITKLTKHSREYHNSKEDFTKEKSSKDGGQDVINLVLEKLDVMEERMTKNR
uniref:Uncharacterized protein n=1 Tax=Lactuca sativa TaxID=4236 RepID=A0A9R1WFI4_LACSA|nr:hypothetical protein LSAT_V11C100020620 [Lactuca sativa]